MKTEYILVPKNTINAYKISNEHTLNETEMAKLVVHRNLLQKVIEQKAIALQFDIWAWLKKWEETLYLQVVEILAEIWKEIWRSKDTFEDYVKQKRIEEEK